MSLHLVGVVWRSSWWLGSRRSPTPSHSSSPSRLLRPAETVHLKLTKGNPHTSYTQLQWLAISGELCKKPWL
ncbi:hypothetical protein Taro_000042, partial [Colocasia esculenta]|nr:hypothetical protein [Colocasia esculenta]